MGIIGCYTIYDYFKFNFDYRELKYEKIGGKNLPSSLFSPSHDKEFSFGLGLPLTFQFESKKYKPKVVKDNKKIGRVIMGSPFDDQVGGMAIDPFGNSYITGFTDGDLNGNQNAGDADIFLIKNNLKGEKVWANQIGKLSTDIGNSVAFI